MIIAIVIPIFVCFFIFGQVKKAESELAYLKDAVESWNCTVLPSDDFTLKPLGARIYLYYPSFGMESSRQYRLIEIAHFMREDEIWRVKITCNNEPVYIDKIFRKLYESIS